MPVFIFTDLPKRILGFLYYSSQTIQVNKLCERAGDHLVCSCSGLSYCFIRYTQMKWSDNPFMMLESCAFYARKATIETCQMQNYKSNHWTHLKCHLMWHLMHPAIPKQTAPAWLVLFHFIKATSLCLRQKQTQISQTVISQRLWDVTLHLHLICSRLFHIFPALKLNDDSVGCCSAKTGFHLQEMDQDSWLKNWKVRWGRYWHESRAGFRL